MSNTNKIKFARSILRASLPAALDYGEPAYVKNSKFLVGNGDGTDFTVNDWSSIQNKPNTYPPPIATNLVLGGVKQGTGVEISVDGTLSIIEDQPHFDCIVPQTMDLLDYLIISGVQACRFDILYYTENKQNLRFETILAAIGASETITWNVTSTQSIGDTSGISPVLTVDGTDLILGVSILRSESWLFSITAYPMILSGSTVTYDASSSRPV